MTPLVTTYIVTCLNRHVSILAHLFLRLYSRTTYAHASMYPRWGFRSTWCRSVACAASAPLPYGVPAGGRTTTRAQLHALVRQVPSPLTVAGAVLLQCLLPPCTHAACSAARSLVAPSRAASPCPAGPSHRLHYTGMHAGCCMPAACARPACSCTSTYTPAGDLARVREPTHGSVTRPCRSREPP